MRHLKSRWLSIMVMLCLCCSPTLAQTVQKVTLHLQRSSLQEVFSAIEKQTTYRFSYRNVVIDQKKDISISQTAISVQKALDIVFVGKKLQYHMVSDKSIVISETVAKGTGAEKKTVSGVVKDETGEPIIGASILEQGTANGTITNIDGGFTLTVSDHSQLNIRYIGYNDITVAVAGKNELSLVLKENAKQLEEVVVVGYGVQRKTDLISAISTVKGKELLEQPVARVDQLLRGRVAGMQVIQANGTPGSGSTIRIRGGNSLSASNEPLYVIDGFVDAGDLNSLNPNDVESIEVLKDATSTAIYGARGSNGVILITTKRGKAGKASFDIEASYGWQQLPKKIDLLSTTEYAGYLNQVADMNGTNKPYADPSKVTGVDWQDVLFRTAPVYNLNFSTNGGTEKFRYLLSLNHFDQQGIMVGSGFKRTTFRTNLDSEIKPWLNVGTTISLSHEFHNVSTAPKNYSLTVYGYGLSPIGSAVNEDGSYNYTEPSRPMGRNPLAEAMLPTDEKNGYSLLNNSYLQLKLNTHWTWKSTVGVKWYYEREDYFSPRKGSFQELRNNAKALTSEKLDMLTEHTLNYSLRTGKHSLTVLGGFTAQKGQSRGLDVAVSNFSNDLTGFNDLNSAQVKESIKSGYKNWGYMSYLSRINYSYNDRYILTAVARYDGSSRFTKGNKWAFFPSVSLGWRISEEAFMKSQKVMNDLKLRMSYGRVGNQAIDIYATQNMYSSSNTILGGQEIVTYIPSDLPNPALTWEKTDQFDLGLDFSFLNSRFTGSLDFYHKTTRDLLWQISVPSYIGQVNQMQNLGSIKNKGVELSLNASIIDEKDWKWDANFNIATNKSKVLDLGPDQEKYVGEHWGGYYSGVLKVGSPIGLFYGQVYDGVLTQAEIDAKGLDARPGDAKFKEIPGDPNNSTVIGNANPDFYGGFGTTVSYKGFSLNAFFQYSVGNEVMNLNYSYFLPGNSGVNCYRDLAEQMWTPSKPDTDVARPSNDFTYTPDSRFIENGSFLRLSSLTLAYDMPKRWLSTIGLAGVRLYFTGNNLFNICDYRGYDPEVSLFSDSPILKGYDWGQYPMNRSFTVGLKLSL